MEFARRPSQPGDEHLAYYAVYSCLSTQRNKGPACVDLLIERLSHPESNNLGGRAAWGLAYGVQTGLGLETKIADTALNIWRNRSDANLRKQALTCLNLYGTDSHAAALGEDQRQALLNVARTIQQCQH